jgi:hypothetical protein
MRCLRCSKTVKHPRGHSLTQWERGWKWQICPTCMKYAKKNRFILEKDNEWSCN